MTSVPAILMFMDHGRQAAEDHRHTITGAGEIRQMRDESDSLSVFVPRERLWSGQRMQGGMGARGGGEIDR